MSSPSLVDSENLHPSAANQQPEEQEQAMKKTASVNKEKDASSSQMTTTTSSSNDKTIQSLSSSYTSIDSESLILPAASNYQPEEQTTLHAVSASSSAAAAATDSTTTENGSSSSTDTTAEEASAISITTTKPTTATTVCRFLVHNLKKGTGVGETFAKWDYYIDLITGQHGLFDLVLQVFDILRSEKTWRDCDPLYQSKQLWDFHFAGIQYSYGYRQYSSSSSSDNKKNHLDEQSVHPLDNLPTPLAEGQKGLFRGQMVSFQVTCIKAVVDNNDDDDNNVSTAATAVSDATSVAAAGEKTEYFQKRWTAVSLPFSSELTDDWILESCKLDMLRLRVDWSTYMSGPCIWKKKLGWDSTDDDTDEYGYYLAKPIPTTWTLKELEFLRLLIRAGCKFKKSWDNVLKYVLVNRPEPASSYQWYKLQKEDFRLEYYGRGLQKNEMLILVKRLAQSAIQKAVAEGIPPLNPEHPFIDMERKLRKRGMIDDTMSPDTNNKILRHYGPEIRYFGNTW